MSFIVEQKIKGNIYLYKAESYWDKKTKKVKQKRTYIGPKNSKKQAVSAKADSKISIQNYGAVFLLKQICAKIGLEKILSDLFAEYRDNILNLCYYQICNDTPEYLFEYWFEKNYLPNSEKLTSKKVSELYTKLGEQTHLHKHFIEKWIDFLKPINAVFYDITSISSYAKNNNIIEWGYNRDGENLPQLNMGVVFCKEHFLPVYYETFPGSLPDVKTLSNTVSYLKSFKMENFLLILDRGFFSKENIIALANSVNKISFIQPLPFSLKKVKELIKCYSSGMRDYSKGFLYNDDLLYHTKEKIAFDDSIFDAHIFLNEETKQMQKEIFLKRLFSIKEKFGNRVFTTMSEYKDFKNNNIAEKYEKYFKWEKASGKIVLNKRSINGYLTKCGVFVIASNEDLERDEIIDYYRSKDDVEKNFDVLKHELTGRRLRGHSKENCEGRIFVKFLSSIIYASISKTMKDKKLFKQYSVRQLLLELDKITLTRINNEKIISERTKRQKIIYDAFDCEWTKT